MGLALGCACLPETRLPLLPASGDPAREDGREGKRPIRLEGRDKLRERLPRACGLCAPSSARSWLIATNGGGGGRAERSSGTGKLPRPAVGRMSEGCAAGDDTWRGLTCEELPFRLWSTVGPKSGEGESDCAAESRDFRANSDEIRRADFAGADNIVLERDAQRNCRRRCD